jgi:DNA topoisomerase VI subunit B
MPSRVVVQFQKHTGSLLASLQAHAPAIAEAVRTQTRAPAHRAGLDADALLTFVARSCDEKLSALLAADDAHARELSDDEAPRARRDESAAALRTEILDVKQSVLALFGDAWAQRLGLAGEIPVDPAMLARTATQVIQALESERLPRPRSAAVGAVRSEAWVTALRAPLDALTEARTAVQREAQEAKGTLAARDAALAALEVANVTAASLAQSLARLGGVSELVAGLRGTIDYGSAAEPAPAPAPEPVPTP